VLHELAWRDGVDRFAVAGSAKLTQSLDQRRRSTGQHQMKEHVMIKVSVMYPNTAGARFDHTYYKDKHMPLLKARMGDACKSYTIDKGLGGGAPGAPATYVGMCHIFCDSIEVSGRLWAACQGDHGRRQELHRHRADHADQRSRRRLTRLPATGHSVAA
jgi:uncharacterized protein (TIGR02118 family)